ncbi:MAG: hypothetical protein OEY01_10585 [Desulfobulbaceae bacterium]|nr:hypothetical protein [Desulfobulbaceae bacterium]HIJ79395.1 hypothetical protein [Deltaproteobacteria bacterium]
MMEAKIFIRLKDLTIFGGVIILTTIVVVLAYGWLYGFDKIGVAASKGEQATTVGFLPRNSTPMHQHMPYPYGAYNQIANQVQQFSTPTKAALAGQYACPQHGAVGMPAFAPGGTAQCPMCGSAMGFRSSPPPQRFGFGFGGW